jgi:hypothetical protein
MGLISALGGLFGAGPARNAAVEHAFEVIAKTIDPTVTSLPNSRDTLQPAVLRALEFYDSSIAAIPGPIDVSRAGHPDSAIVRSLFPNGDEITQSLGRSLALRSSIRWFVDHGHDDVHALLGMRVRPGANGGGFADHTFRSLGTHDQDSREVLREAAFVSLVKAFDSRMKDKRREWRLRHTDLRISDELRSRNGDEPLSPAAEDQRDEILDRHAGASHDLTPERALEALIEWLSRPEKQLMIGGGEGHPLIGAPTADGRGELHLPTLASADRRKWFVCLVRFPLAEALTAISQETQPHRYILI